MQRYIQTGTVKENDLTIYFNSVAKTEFEINMQPKLKEFLNEDFFIKEFTVKDSSFIVYTTVEENLNKVVELFTLYSKYNSTKKDIHGVWGLNTIRDFFNSDSNKELYDFWFCFEGGEAPWLVIVKEKEAHFFMAAKQQILKDDSPVFIYNEEEDKEYEVSFDKNSGFEFNLVTSGITDYESLVPSSSDRPTFFEKAMLWINKWMNKINK